MKKVIDINIGGINFAMEDDAFVLLKTYMSKFESSISNPEDIKEVMEDVELRIAELFQKEIKSLNQVVNEEMVSRIIEFLGVVNDFDTTKQEYEKTFDKKDQPFSIAGKRLYRDPDDTKIAGVCSGISHYLNIDVTLIRILFLIALICYSTGFWIYVIFWIAVPVAGTISQKLEMRGIPVTAENIRKYSSAFGNGYKRNPKA